MSSCQPYDPEYDLRSNHGIEALKLAPFLADDFYAALKHKESCRWLDSHDIPFRAAYINELFTASVLDRQQVLSALDHGIAKHWDKLRLPGYKKLREHISQV